MDRALALADLCVQSWKDFGLTTEQILHRINTPNPEDDRFAVCCLVDPNEVRRLMRSLVVN